MRVEPVELDFVERVDRASSESSCAVRQCRHSQNAWARHVERVESSRVVSSRAKGEFGLYSLKLYSYKMSEWPKAFDRTPLEPGWVQGGCRTTPVGLKGASRQCRGRYTISCDPTRGTKSVGATESATTGARWLKHAENSDGYNEASVSLPRRSTASR